MDAFEEFLGRESGGGCCPYVGCTNWLMVIVVVEEVCGGSR